VRRVGVCYSGLAPQHLRSESAVQEREETEFVSSLKTGGPAEWRLFLNAYADAILRIVRIFAESYDDRMDLFLFVCDRLKEADMKKVRSFQFRPEAPCRFTTYLSVVIKNIAVDFIRSKGGRFRPFRGVGDLDEAGRLIFEYRLRDGRPIEEVVSLLQGRHGIKLGADEVSRRVERLEARLSTNQRWRLLSRLFARRRPLPIDPVAEVAFGRSEHPVGERAVPLRADRADPERVLCSADAERIFQEAMTDIAPNERLALTLRFRDGLSAREAGPVMGIPPALAERLAHQGLEKLRAKLGRSRIARSDLESADLAFIWRG